MQKNIIFLLFLINTIVWVAHYYITNDFEKTVITLLAIGFLVVGSSSLFGDEL